MIGLKKATLRTLPRSSCITPNAMADLPLRVSVAVM
jgi:hypothetical protein